MVRIEITNQAFEDIDSISEFIARDSQVYARLFIKDIFLAIEQLSVFPSSGRVVPEYGNQIIREVILGSYRIIYLLDSELVQILTVYHSARLLPHNGKF